jgi:hypothetical protein
MKLVALLVAALVALTLSRVEGLQSAPYDAVLAKLDAYLAEYEPKLSELIADEVMFQEMTGSTTAAARLPVDVAPLPMRATIRRQLRSEVAFIALPQDSGWLGFRHVKAVNRQTLADDQSLTAVLAADGFDRARALIEASAAHNLGLPRTTNLPNLPLEFLHRRNRHRLVSRFDGRERVQDVNTDRVVFHEKVTPTLIVNPQGGDMPSTIRAWIDPANGRLLRAEVRTFKYPSAPRFENSVEVEFEQDKKLGLLVPKEMREIFPGDPGTGKSSAVYTNYRRFQTSGRIVPQ